MYNMLELDKCSARNVKFLTGIEVRREKRMSDEILVDDRSRWDKIKKRL